MWRSELVAQASPVESRLQEDNMASSVNFDNGAERFNINLDAQGNLNFNANNTDGNGDRRLSLLDDSGTLNVGGGGKFGALQLTNATGGGTLFIGADQNGASAVFGGGNSGLNGRMQLFNSAGGQSRIDLNGSNGAIRCVSLTQTSDVRLKKGITPLSDVLDKVIALRGVRYQWKHEDGPTSGCSDSSEIGLVGQEVESVYPELVTTDSDGYLSLNYARLTAVLVEAIKEQQQLIKQQASAFAEALQRIARLEAALDAGRA
jgi:hypothetical protein